MRNFRSALNVILRRYVVTNGALHLHVIKKEDEFKVQFCKEPLSRGKPLQPPYGFMSASSPVGYLYKGGAEKLPASSGL